MPKFKVWNPEVDNLSGASEFECDEAEDAAEKYMRNNSHDPDGDTYVSLMVMDEDGACSAVDVDIELEPSFYCGEQPENYGFDVIVLGEGCHGADIYSWKGHDGTSGASFNSFEDAQQDGQRHVHEAENARRVKATGDQECGE